jgi:SAM-dependent methyltransferase
LKPNTPTSLRSRALREPGSRASLDSAKLRRNTAMNRLRENSVAMDFFRAVGWDSIAWSLRRVHCPVPKEALVLEVGSGGNPCFRSNVLLDAYEDTPERWNAALVHDRPTVIGQGENLPFKDQAFDFIIAYHVLEHSTDPERFLSELQRVANAGYIEVPDALMERLTAYWFHRLEIQNIDGELVIRKKRGYVHDPEVYGIFKHKAAEVFPRWMGRFPFHFHARYYWTRDAGGIRYRIVNPEYQFDWDIPDPDVVDSGTEPTLAIKVSAVVKAPILRGARKLLSQHRRNRRLDLIALMKCTACGGESLRKISEGAVCNGCGARTRILS